MPNPISGDPPTQLPALVLIHLTTSGPSLDRDQLLEVSLARVDGGHLGDPWHRLINPHQISEATRLQLGLHAQDLSTGINLAELQQQLDDFCANRLLVGFGLRQQLAFLKATGLKLPRGQQLCLQKAAPELERNPALKGLGLLDLAERLGLYILRPWRAADRLLILWQLLLRWQPDLIRLGPQLLKQQFQQRLLPVHLDPELLEQLPETPGVYRMFAAPDAAGEAPLPLYIGKSIHLRTRVKSHFSADQRSTKALRMVQEVQTLDWIPAAGDLGAQLKEAQQIKALQPRMNRRLRRQKKLFTWQQQQSQEPLQLLPFEPLQKQATATCFGLFNSRQQAKNKLAQQAEAHQLCPALLGLEARAPGQACFAFQLNRCQGACCGLESLDHHQQRLEAAFQQWRFQHWPWDGPCLLEEQGAGGCEYHALNAWQYLGSAASPEQAWPLAEQPLQHFDRDTYRLLKKVLQPQTRQLAWQGSQLKILTRK